MHSDKSERLYDVRTVERNIKKGLVDSKGYQKHLSSLSDSKSQCELIDITDDIEDGMPKADDYKD